MSVADPLLNGKASAIAEVTAPDALTVDMEGFARLIGASRSWLYSQWSAGRVPLGLKVGGKRMFLVSEIRAWLASGAPVRSEWTARQASAAARARTTKLRQQGGGANA